MQASTPPGRPGLHLHHLHPPLERAQPTRTLPELPEQPPPTGLDHHDVRALRLIQDRLAQRLLSRGRRAQGGRGSSAAGGVGVGAERGFRQRPAAQHTLAQARGRWPAGRHPGPGPGPGTASRPALWNQPSPPAPALHPTSPCLSPPLLPRGSWRGPAGTSSCWAGSRGAPGPAWAQTPARPCGRGGKGRGKGGVRQVRVAARRAGPRPRKRPPGWRQGSPHYFPSRPAGTGQPRAPGRQGAPAPCQALHHQSRSLPCTCLTGRGRRRRRRTWRCRP